MAKLYYNFSAFAIVMYLTGHPKQFVKLRIICSCNHLHAVKTCLSAAPILIDFKTI